MVDTLRVPSDDRIATLSLLLEKKFNEEKIHKRYAPVKHVLTLVGLAGLVGMAFASPGGAEVGKSVLGEMRKKRDKQWKKYNEYYLRRAIRRLHTQKLVEIKEQGNTQTVILTDSGRRKILKYALDDLSIPTPHHWDGKWRMIMYDVDEHKKKLRDIFRETLKTLGFYKLQESTWIYPYPCENQVTFLREYYGVGNEVLYVVATRLEDDSPYRTYFGLDD